MQVLGILLQLFMSARDLRTGGSSEGIFLECARHCLQFASVDARPYDPPHMEAMPTPSLGL